MDESLVLLGDFLCWDLVDLVFFAKNARRDSAKLSFNATIYGRLRKLNAGDERLYERFLERHQRAVVTFGVKRMAEQVLLRQIVYCLTICFELN